ncbi:MAG: hypothetical protein CMO55_14615 [Verrucomicrobiales bacterium]|nr:hypothetical protein [Verrucomicrobiales bacterium]
MKPLYPILLSLLLAPSLYADVPWTIDEWEERWQSIDESVEKKHLGDRDIGGDEIGGTYSARSYMVELSKTEDRSITAAIRLVAVPSVGEIMEYSFMIMENDAEGNPLLPPASPSHQPTAEEISQTLELLSGEAIKDISELEKLPVSEEELGVVEGKETKEVRRLTENAVLIIHHVLYSDMVRFEIRKKAR